MNCLPCRPGLGKRPAAGVHWWVLLCVGLTACRPSPVTTDQALVGQTMGTTYSIKLVPFEGMPFLTEVSRDISAELEQVNAQMSTYLTTSELSRFNASKSTDWVPVSPATAAVVEQSLELTRLTEGAFDVTVGPLVNLWGFGPGPRSGRAPSEAAIAEVLRYVGADKLQVRASPPALKKAHPQLQVDLSAIAKGHGVDRVAQRLDSLGFTAYFVEIGGEVRCRGRKLDGAAWQVGIERPSSAERSVQRVLPLVDRSLATSGNYRNYFEEAGHQFSHTIDPRSGRPVEDSIASASVTADSCALADGIATGLMAAGFEKGLELAERHGWSVLLLRPLPGGELEIAQSSSFLREFPQASD